MEENNLNRESELESIDIKVLVEKFITRWRWFAVSVPLCLVMSTGLEAGGTKRSCGAFCPAGERKQSGRAARSASKGRFERRVPPPAPWRVFLQHLRSCEDTCFFVYSNFFVAPRWGSTLCWMFLAAAFICRDRYCFIFWHWIYMIMSGNYAFEQKQTELLWCLYLRLCICI